MSVNAAWSQRVETDSAPRLDKWLVQQLPELSRNRWQQLISEGQVTVDGAVARVSVRLRQGQQIDVATLIQGPQSDFIPYQLELDVIYEDDDLAIVDKPANLVMHPAPGHPLRTLANAVAHQWPDMAASSEQDRPGIVHRLDKDTSGLVAIAKTPAAHTALQQQFKSRTISKTYLALVDGLFQTLEGVVDVPLGRHPKNRKRQAAFPPTRPGEDTAPAVRSATTRFRVRQHLQSLSFRESFPFSLVELEPLSGRTHQIRVHMAFLSHPIVGDELYGLRSPRLVLKRHFLHASRLGFVHPFRNSFMVFYSPLPLDLQDCLKKLSPFLGA